MKCLVRESIVKNSDLAHIVCEKEKNSTANYMINTQKICSAKDQQHLFLHTECDPVRMSCEQWHVTRTEFATIARDVENKVSA